MTSSLRVVSLLTALGGCSWIYNPNNLPEDAQSRRIDAAMIDTAIPIDQPTVIDTNGLALQTAGPHILLEGQGTGGSRPAVLTITGHDIAADATLTLVGATEQPMIEIDNAHAVRSLSGTSIAVPITLPVDPTRGAGEIALSVQIVQAGRDGPIAAQLDGAVIVRTLPELTAVPTTIAPLYSRVALTAALTFAAKAGPPIVIRAVSSIELLDVHLDANKNVPGVGGNAGGATGAAGAGPGGGLPGALLGTGVISTGSGGGFAAAGSSGASTIGNPTPGGAAAGDDLLLLATNVSSGGGGGAVQPGGGGGGTLELTAGGTLQAGVITANGGVGGADGPLSGAGGGGSGGAILLRSGGPATISKVFVAGGAGGDHSQTGQLIAGAGASGRLRYDVAKLVGAPMLPTASRAGVSFSVADGANPLITSDAQQPITVGAAVNANAATNVFDVFVFDAEGATTGSSTITFASPVAAFKPGLTPGYNRVCLTPDGKNPLIDVTATSCLEIAYVP